MDFEGSDSVKAMELGEAIKRNILQQREKRAREEAERTLEEAQVAAEPVSDYQPSAPALGFDETDYQKELNRLDSMSDEEWEKYWNAIPVSQDSLNSAMEEERRWRAELAAPRQAEMERRRKANEQAVRTGMPENLHKTGNDWQDMNNEILATLQDPRATPERLEELGEKLGRFGRSAELLDGLTREQREQFHKWRIDMGTLLAKSAKQRREQPDDLSAWQEIITAGNRWRYQHADALLGLARVFSPNGQAAQDQAAMRELMQEPGLIASRKARDEWGVNRFLSVGTEGTLSMLESWASGAFGKFLGTAATAGKSAEVVSKAAQIGYTAGWTIPFGVQTGGAKFGEAYDRLAETRPDLSPEERYARAMGEAATAAAIEIGSEYIGATYGMGRRLAGRHAAKLPMGSRLRKMFVNDTTKKLAVKGEKEMLGKAIDRVVAAGLSGYLEEFGEEVAADAANNIADQMWTGDSEWAQAYRRFGMRGVGAAVARSAADNAIGVLSTLATAGAVESRWQKTGGIRDWYTNPMAAAADYHINDERAALYTAKGLQALMQGDRESAAKISDALDKMGLDGKKGAKLMGELGDRKVGPVEFLDAAASSEFARTQAGNIDVNVSQVDKDVFASPDGRGYFMMLSEGDNILAVTQVADAEQAAFLQEMAFSFATGKLSPSLRGMGPGMFAYRRKDGGWGVRTTYGKLLFDSDTIFENGKKAPEPNVAQLQPLPNFSATVSAPQKSAEQIKAEEEAEAKAAEANEEVTPPVPKEVKPEEAQANRTRANEPVDKAVEQARDSQKERTRARIEELDEIAKTRTLSDEEINERTNLQDYLEELEEPTSPEEVEAQVQEAMEKEEPVPEPEDPADEAALDEHDKACGLQYWCLVLDNGTSPEAERAFKYIGAKMDEYLAEPMKDAAFAESVKGKLGDFRAAVKAKDAKATAAAARALEDANLTWENLRRYDESRNHVSGDLYNLAEGKTRRLLTWQMETVSGDTVFGNDNTHVPEGTFLAVVDLAEPDVLWSDRGDPRYPMDLSQNRKSTPQRQAKINEMANDFNARRALSDTTVNEGIPSAHIENGAVIIDIGNTHTAAAARAYELGKNEGLREAVAEWMKAHDITLPEDVGTLKQPYIVRMLPPGLDAKTLSEIVRKGNESALQTQTATANIDNDARVVRDNLDTLVPLLKPNDNGSLLGAENQDFFNEFRRLAGDREGSAEITLALENRAKKALMAALFYQMPRDERQSLIENVVIEDGADSASLNKVVSGTVAKIGGLLALEVHHPEYALSSDLADVFKNLVAYKKGRMSGNYSSTEDYLHGDTLFDTETAGDASRRMTALEEMLFQRLADAKSAKDIRQFFNNYLERVDQIIRPEESLFGEEAKTREEILAEMLNLPQQPKAQAQPTPAENKTKPKTEEQPKPAENKTEAKTEEQPKPAEPKTEAKAEEQPKPAENKVEPTRKPAESKPGEVWEPTDDQYTALASMVDEEGNTSRINGERLRRFAREWGVPLKTVQEWTEGIIARQANYYAFGAWISTSEKWRKILALYNRQPIFGERTSTSVMNQAYSTPAPIGWILGHRIGADSGEQMRFVLEPTAGTGMLLSAFAHTKHINLLNEIDPLRLKILKRLWGRDSDIYNLDASKTDFLRINDGKQKWMDFVVTNPPFKGAEPQQFGAFSLSKLDHIIAARALNALKPDGRAFVIVGAYTTKSGINAGKPAIADMVFMNFLYSYFNVKDNYVLGGDVYGKQGTEFPIRVFTIDGRKKFNGVVSAPVKIETLDNYDAIYEKFHEPLPKVEYNLQLDSLDDIRYLESAMPLVKQAATKPAPAKSTAEAKPPEPKPTAKPVKPTTAKPAETKPAAQPASGIKWVNDEDAARFAELTARLKKKLGGQLNVGIDPEILSIGCEMAFLVVKHGATKFADFARAMIQQLGDMVRPYLKAFYNGSRDMPEMSEYAKDMTAYEEVRAFDVENFDKQTQEQATQEQTEQAQSEQPQEQATQEQTEQAQSEQTEQAQSEQPQEQATQEQTEQAQSEQPQQSAKSKEEEEYKGEIPLGETIGNGKFRKYTSASTAYTVEKDGKKVPVIKDGEMAVDDYLAVPQAKAQSAFLEEYGNPADFVKNRLGYDNLESVGKAFLSHQVDGIAQAVANLERGRSFIIGDGTGAGKGRFQAGIMRWAIRNGYLPVFFTEKPTLFTDMYFDGKDIGLDFKPLILGDRSAGTIVNRRGDGEPLVVPPAKRQEAFEDIRKGEGGYNALFTNYSQLNRESNKQLDFMRKLVRDRKCVFILDEAHNAAGDESNINLNLMELTANTPTVFASATFAKRPDNFRIYAQQVLKGAGVQMGNIDRILKQGGVPLLQVMSQNLAQSGLYRRVEKDLSDVKVLRETVTPSDYSNTLKTYDATVSILRALVAMSDYIREKVAEKHHVKGLSEGQRAENYQAFSSRVHNVIAQMLLCAKVNMAADEAIKAIKEGRKPVIALTSTGEGRLADYAMKNNISNGEHCAYSFTDYILSELDAIRFATVASPTGHGSDRVEIISEDDPMIVAMKERIKAELNGVNWAASPIDAIRQRIEDAGFTTGEITGRTVGIDYSDGKQVLRTRDANEKDRNQVIRKFNNGGWASVKSGGENGIDCIVINTAGSTGISLHASEMFKDQHQRELLMVQPSLDINIVMQTLGRVHRVGQVVPPIIRFLSTPLIAEKRPAQIMANKLAMLSAATTADAKGVVSTDRDIMDNIGDKVAVFWIGNNTELARGIGLDYIDDGEDNGGSGTNKKSNVGMMRRLLGRLAMVENENQAQILDALEQQHNEEIDRLIALDQYHPDVTNYKDWAAVDVPGTEETMFEGNKNGTLFEQPVVLKQIEKSERKQIPSLESVMERRRKNVGSTKAEIQERLDNAFAPSFAAVDSLEDGGDEDPSIYAQMRSRLNNMKMFIADWLDKEGTLLVQLGDASTRCFGIVTGYKVSGSESDNPGLYSNVQVEFALVPLPGVDSDMKPIPALKLSMGKFFNPSNIDRLRLNEGNVYRVDAVTSNNPYVRAVLSEAYMGFDEVTPERVFTGKNHITREKRYIGVGNLLRAFEDIGKGKVIRFDYANGDNETAVLYPKSWKRELVINDPKLDLKTAEEAIKFVEDWWSGHAILTRDGNLRIAEHQGDWRISAPTRPAGHGINYATNSEVVKIIGDMTQAKGKGWRATVKNREAVSDLIRYLFRTNIGTNAAMRKQNDNAEKQRWWYSQADIEDNGPIPRGVTIKEVNDIAEREGFTCRVVAVDNEQDLPDEVLQQVERDRRRGVLDDWKGIYDAESDTVYLNAPMLDGIQDARETIIHEGLVHYGMRALFHSNEARRAFLDKAASLAYIRVAARNKELEGLDHYTAIEEAVADAAEDEAAKPVWRKILQWLKDAWNNFFARVGGREVPSDTWFRNTLKDMAQAARTRDLSHVPTVEQLLFSMHLQNNGAAPSAAELAEAVDEHLFYSRVSNKKIVGEFQEKGKYIETYRSAIKGDDGKLYPPMATKGAEGMKLMQAYKADEHPEMVRKDGTFPLKSDMRDSGKNGTVYAAYNPYFHSQPGVLNDQFAVAYDKGRMVTVRCRVLKSDLESGYHAEKAKDSVGENRWPTEGPVTRQLTGHQSRRVFMSRYIMPVEIVPDSEVAKMIKEQIGDADVTIPWNVVKPSLREELVKAGVKVGSEEEFRAAEASKRAKGRQTLVEKIVSDYRDAGVYLVQRGFNGTILEAGSIEGIGSRVLREIGFDTDDNSGAETEKQYDAVVVPDAETAREMASRVAPGGRLLVTDATADEVAQVVGKEWRVESPSGSLVVATRPGTRPVTSATHGKLYYRQTGSERRTNMLSAVSSILRRGTEWAKTYLSWGDTRGGVHPYINQAMQQMKGTVTAELEKLRLLLKDIQVDKTAIAKESWSEAVLKDMDLLVKGKDVSEETKRLAASDPRVANLLANITRGRDMIDALSLRMVSEMGDVLPEGLRLTIDNNRGVYTLRAYEKFLNPDYKPTDEVMKQAEAAVRQEILERFYALEDRINNRRYKDAGQRATMMNYLATRDEGILDGQDEKFQRRARMFAYLIDNAIKLTDNVFQSTFDSSGIAFDYDSKGLANIAQGTVDYLLAKDTKEGGTPEATSGSGRWLISRKSFLQRKDLPEWLRELYGEITDATALIQATAARGIRVLAANTMFKELLARNEEMDESDPERVFFYAGHHNEKATVKLEGFGYGVLNGMFTDLHTARMLQDYFGMGGEVQKVWKRALALMRASKTVWNLPTHFRNLLGNIAFVSNDGLLTNPKYPLYWARAAKILASDAEAARKERIRLMELGLIGGGAHNEEFHRTMVEAFGDSAQFKDFPGLGFLSWMKKPGKFMETLYAFEDNVFRLASYYAWKGMGKTDEEAVANVREIYPTYDQAPVLLDVMRRYNPLAPDFLAFRIDSMRCFGNAISSAIKAFRRGDVREGLMRAAGVLATTSMALQIVSAGIGGLLGMFPPDDDEEYDDKRLSGEEMDALRLLLPFYRQDNLVWPWWDGKQVRYVDMGYVYPIEQLPRLWNMLSTRGIPTDEKISELAKYVLGDYIGSNMAADTLADLMRNQNSSGRKIWGQFDTPFEKFAKGMAHLASSVAPSSVIYGTRAARMWMSEEDSLVASDGSIITPASEAAKTVQPIRVYQMDPAVAYQRRMRTFANEVRDKKAEANIQMRRARNHEIPMSEARKAVDATREKLADSSLVTYIHNADQAGKTLGLSRDTRLQLLKDAGFTIDESERILARRPLNFVPSEK